MSEPTSLSPHNRAVFLLALWAAREGLSPTSYQEFLEILSAIIRKETYDNEILPIIRDSQNP